MSETARSIGLAMLATMVLIAASWLMFDGGLAPKGLNVRSSPRIQETIPLANR